VASHSGESAGASGLRPGDQVVPQTGAAHVIVASAPAGDSEVALTLTLGVSAGEGHVELLGLVATMAAGAVGALGG
jgi:hypothetical protein